MRELELGDVGAAIATAIVEARDVAKRTPSRELSLVITKMEEALHWFRAIPKTEDYEDWTQDPGEDDAPDVLPSE